MDPEKYPAPCAEADLNALAAPCGRAASGHPAGSPAGAPSPAGAAARSYVVDRHGARVPVRFDRITERVERLCRDPAYGPALHAIDAPAITAEVVLRFRNGMTARELDAETAAICVQRASSHSDNEWLAARLHVSDLHKRAPAAMPDLLAALRAAGGARFSDEFEAVVRRAAEAVAARLDAARDYRLRFFGYQTLARSYLLRPAGAPVGEGPSERPQHLYMRAALGIFVCQPDGRGHEAPEPVFAQRLADAFRLYDALSLQLVSHATPTLLNAGTAVPQLSSCFQLATGDDLPALFDTVTSAALISKWSGGISLWLHGLRAEGALIRGTGGRSTGVKRFVKILNEVQLYVDQGGNRPGAFAVYLGVDHADVFTFLRQARLKGEEALQGLTAPDLKYALWVPDLFMEALAAQLAGGDDPAAGDWHLFSPDEAPGLHLAVGDEYRALYARYVAEGRARARVKAGDVMAEAFRTWAQAGVPYVLFKDAVNRKSNLRHVAPICSSNLCAEVLIPSWSAHDAPTFARFHPDNAAGGESGVCNLAAVCLESFVGAAPAGAPAGAALDFGGIAAAAGLEARALNRVIDLNYYPSEPCRRSNRRHRPIGVGVMGLADVLARLGLVYGSPEAVALARGVAAAVYFGALSESCREAEAEGPHPSFAGSPAAAGLLQPDLWVEAGHLAPGWEAEVEAATHGALRPADWAALRARARRGVRNAYVTAYMPTATTSNVVGQNECFEPFTSNLYPRKTLAGEFLVANRHLMRRLADLGLWDEKMRRELLTSGGSVQGIERVPADVRRLFRTAREVHPSLVVRMVAGMAPFVCQSLSMNLFLDEPSLPRILRFLMEGWRAGLKTGMYYCHVKPAAGSQKSSAMLPGADAPGGTPAAPGGSPAAVCSDEVCTSCAL